jgi:hypothetical protein
MENGKNSHEKWVEYFLMMVLILPSPKCHNYQKVGVIRLFVMLAHDSRTSRGWLSLAEI